MEKLNKLIEKILRGRSDASIGFEELRSLLKGLRFEERIHGSHHIYRRVDIDERLNLQREGAEAKPPGARPMRSTARRLSCTIGLSVQSGSLTGDD